MPNTHLLAQHPAIAAMVLAAGRGERMRPLTDTCPKPLLQVQGKPLMQRPLEALGRGGFTHAVVNTAWLGEQIASTFGSVLVLQPASDVREQLLNSEHSSKPALENSSLQEPLSCSHPSSQRQIQLLYSHEGRDFGAALETAGGIARALPLLCANDTDAFWVLAGDVFAPDFAFTQAAVEHFLASDKLAHLWLVPNPEHNPLGDFGLGQGLALNLPKDTPQPRYTYSTIGLYRRTLFAPPWCDIAPGNPQGIKAALAPLLRRAMDSGLVSAELYTGRWTDVGTPQRLAQLNAFKR